MPIINCKKTTRITRDNPGAPVSAAMSTYYSPVKQFAYYSVATDPVTGQPMTYNLLNPVTGVTDKWSVLNFASPIPVGSSSTTKAWVNGSDWEFALA